MTEALFGLAFVIAVAAWFFAIIEMIAIHSFWTAFFRFGIPALKETLEIDTKGLSVPPDKTIKKDEGKFRFSSDGKVYFLSQFFMFKFRMTTPFPFKVTGTIRNDGNIDLVARLPLGTTLFFLMWLLGWTAGAIGMAIGSGNVGAVFFGLIGWVVAGGMYMISYAAEKPRFDTMTVELKEIITAYNTHQT